MKRSDLKELIKKSMVEVAPKKDSGAMTPEEEKMVADYEEEKANKYAVGPKEEPLEEILNIPDDIEWEWDGQVLDQVDSYSAEIGLEGYSPSTGHSFTASVPAYDNGGDWEWNEGDIDFIEQAPMEEDILREADEIVAAYAEKKTLKEEMHGGYLELLEMNPDFENGARLLLNAWFEWKEGPMTEPQMVDEARQDILAYLSSMMR
jgi:hypothetical protein